MSVELQKANSEIRIASDFSRTPGGRYYSDGPASGEQFREELLLPALKESRTVTVVLDGARGYPSSFLEEAFGGTARKLGLSADEFFKRISFQATPEFEIYIEDIRFHVNRVVDGRNS